jgi:hemolysin activation/secretion protein
VRRRIAALLGKLVGKPDFGLAQIERQLLLAAQVPGVRLRSTLAPGSAPGTSILVAEADHQLVTGLATLDNLLPDALGNYSYGFGINLNSVWGLGELTYLRANGLPNIGHRTSVLDLTPRNRALAAGIVVPLDLDGTSLTLEGVDSRTAPRHAAALPGFASRFQRVSVRLRNPYLLRRTVVAAAELSFDAQDERFSLIDPLTLPLYHDRLRVVRVGGDLNALVAGGGQLGLRATVSFGLDALGARAASDATPLLPLSRQGANASFVRLQVEASLNQPIGKATIVVQARGQTSFGDPLVNAEQIGIAGTDVISPLGSGSFQGDRGYVARAELQAPSWVWRKASGALTPYAFAAIGGVAYARPTALELPHMEAAAWGAGLRLGAARGDGFTRFNLGLEWGRAEIRPLASHNDRFSFTASLQF